jgi:hypothetical protein
MRIAFAALAALLPVAPAQVRDNGQYAEADPHIREWIRGLTNQKGEGCCDTADGYPAEVEWDTQTGAYRVRIDGRWWPVPRDAVIAGPNRLGYAVVWYGRWPDGEPLIRCFLPGSGT